MTRNYHHYSYYTKRLPLSVTNWVQKTGSNIYFNPLIPMKTFKNEDGRNLNDQRKFKYGVIGLDKAKSDLINWDSFAFAGRLHKPVLPFIEEDKSFADALDLNRDQALNLALLLNFDKAHVDMLDLAITICQLSYKGDVRMKFKMENPNKVKNIVIGSFDGLNFLYGKDSLRLNKLVS